MTLDDLRAMATYLKDVPGATVLGSPLSCEGPAMVAGKAIYEDECSACHKRDGTGVPYPVPNLADSTSVSAEDAATLVRVVLSGAQSIATDREPTGPSMPSYGWATLRHPDCCRDDLPEKPLGARRAGQIRPPAAGAGQKPRVSPGIVPAGD